MRGCPPFSVSSYLLRPIYRLFGELLEGILQVFRVLLGLFKLFPKKF